MGSTNSDTGSSASSGSGSAEKGEQQQLSESSASPKPQSTEPDNPKPESTGPASPKPESTGQASLKPDSTGQASPKPESKPKSTEPASSEPQQRGEKPEEVIQKMVLDSVRGGSSPKQPQPITGTQGRPNPLNAAAQEQLDKEETKQQQQANDKTLDTDTAPSTPRLGSNGDD